MSLPTDRPTCLPKVYEGALRVGDRLRHAHAVVRSNGIIDWASLQHGKKKSTRPIRTRTRTRTRRKGADSERESLKTHFLKDSFVRRQNFKPTIQLPRQNPRNSFSRTPSPTPIPHVAHTDKQIYARAHTYTHIYIHTHTHTHPPDGSPSWGSAGRTNTHAHTHAHTHSPT